MVATSLSSVISWAAVASSLLVGASRDEVQRPLLHYTPLNHYMHLPAAVHWFGNDLHIYYVKGVNNSTSNEPARDWGHVSTSDGSTFSEYPTKFLTLDTNFEASIETGAFLPVSSLGLDNRHVLFYESINPKDNIAIRSRITNNAITAMPLTEKPNGGLTITTGNAVPNLFPTAFTFNNVACVAYLTGGGTANVMVNFVTPAIKNEVFSFAAVGSYDTGNKSHGRSLQITQIGASNYMIVMSFADAEKKFYYPHYVIGSFALDQNNLLVFTQSTSSGSFGALDLGHDATDWKMEAYSVNGVYKVSAVAVASNNYVTASIPTDPWRNGLTLVRTLELTSAGIKQSYILNSKYMTTMKEIVPTPGVALGGSCIPYTFSINADRGAYQLMLEFNKEYIVNGGIRIELYHSSNNMALISFQVTPSQTVQLTTTIQRIGTPNGFPNERTATVPISPSSLTGKNFHIIVDTTSVEIFMEEGAIVASENYFTTQFDTICVKTVTTGKVTLASLHSHKYRSLFSSIGASSSTHCVISVLVAVVASFFWF